MTALSTSRRVIVPLALAVLSLASGVAGPVARAGTPTTRPPLVLGVSDIDDSWTLEGLDRETASLGGHVPAIWSLWRGWGTSWLGPFPPRALLDGIADRGAVPLLYWQMDTDVTYAQIAAGQYDDYLHRWAADARAFGRPVLVRYAFEMNGTWMPWSVGRPGNSPAEFLAAWRRIVGTVRGDGATNVRFIWNPSFPGPRNGTPIADIWPGDAWVDYVGIDAYNWARSGWKSMVDLYAPAMKAIRALTWKRVIICETASSPDGGDKAAWIRDGYREVYRRWPGIIAIVYFDIDMRSVGHEDWRLESPTGARAEYRRLLGLARFSGSLSGAGTTRWLARPS